MGCFQPWSRWLDTEMTTWVPKIQALGNLTTIAFSFHQNLAEWDGKLDVLQSLGDVHYQDVSSFDTIWYVNIFDPITSKSNDTFENSYQHHHISGFWNMVSWPAQVWCWPHFFWCTDHYFATSNQVAKHNSRESLWIIVDNMVYDATRRGSQLLREDG